MATNAGLTVAEGAAGTIGQAQLEVTDEEQGAAELTFTVTSLPANGSLTRDGNAVAENGTFTQDDVNNDLGVTVLMVEHDMNLVARASDRVLAMSEGKVITVGTPSEVQQHP